VSPPPLFFSPDSDRFCSGQLPSPAHLSVSGYLLPLNRESIPLLFLDSLSSPRFKSALAFRSRLLERFPLYPLREYPVQTLFVERGAFIGKTRRFPPPPHPPYVQIRCPFSPAWRPILQGFPLSLFSQHHFTFPLEETTTPRPHDSPFFF